MKRLSLVITILALVALMSACATFPQAKVAVLAKQGDTIHLFHGGFTSAKEEFCVNDVVPVYRYTGKRYQKYAEVGKIKITGYVGEHYLEGVVVEGNIKDSDFAKKTNAACLIHLPESDEK